jgi:hypothetical protein
MCEGVERGSRNGPVMQHTEAVSTVYACPDERVMFHACREANPFSLSYESLWMLSGRRDVAPLARFVKRMSSFSDDGQIFNAAYGYRWRHGVDQLQIITKILRENNEDRRCVLLIWSIDDLGKDTKDAACNLTATFQVAPNGMLNMVVFCRSNDIIWGCYGANAVHFSMLHEYVASSIGRPIGTYTQVSVNWHAYTGVLNRLLKKREAVHECPDPYWHAQVQPYPLMSVPQREWDADVVRFVTDCGYVPRCTKFNDPFFNNVALPIVRAHDFYKDGLPRKAFEALEECHAEDWRRACHEWLERRA